MLPRKTLLRLGVLYGEQGDCEKAGVILDELAEADPEDPDLLKALAKTAEIARNYDLARDRWKDLSERFPDSGHILTNYIKSLIKTSELAEAQGVLDQQQDVLDPAAQAIIQADIHEAQLDWDSALKILHEARLRFPDKPTLFIKEIRLQMLMFRRFGNPELLSNAQFQFEEVKRAFPDNPSLKILHAELLILSGQHQEAANTIERLPDNCAQKIMELKAWAAHIRGDEDRAKKIWREIQAIHYIPQVKSPPPQALKRADAHSLEVASEEILLFTVIRNERWRLPWFLDYYRSLGVDRFFFIDNDSNDGSREYLVDQGPDVHVFWTKDSYGNACSGMQWVNELVGKFGDENWCLYVDVDEALIFPGVENSDLRALTNYMDSKGHEAMFAFMNDMFADGEGESVAEDETEDFLASYPLFDNFYHFSDVIYCPYRFVSGGLRIQFGIGEMLTKTPIIKGGRGIKFLLSSHRITPAVMTDVTGALLHFKLAGNFQEKFLEDVEKNTRIPECQRRHMAYSNGLQQLEDTSKLSSDVTLRYASSKQLLELGLIECPTGFPL